MSRKILIALAAAVVLGCVAAGVVVLRGGDDAAAQRRELTAAFAGHLESTGQMSAKNAGCVAKSAVDKIGAERLKGVDLKKADLPDRVKTDFVAAVAAGMGSCKVIATGSDTKKEVPVAETVDSLTAVYADQLGIDDKRAACVAETVVGWQLGPDAVEDGGKKPLTDALDACGIKLSEVKKSAS